MFSRRVNRASLALTDGATIQFKNGRSFSLLDRCICSGYVFTVRVVRTEPCFVYEWLHGIVSRWKSVHSVRVPRVDTNARTGV